MVWFSSVLTRWAEGMEWCERRVEDDSLSGLQPEHWEGRLPFIEPG